MSKRTPGTVIRFGCACDPTRRCIALNARNRRCGNPPIVGQALCPSHIHEAVEVEGNPAPGFWEAIGKQR